MSKAYSLAVTATLWPPGAALGADGAALGADEAALGADEAALGADEAALGADEVDVEVHAAPSSKATMSDEPNFKRDMTSSHPTGRYRGRIVAVRCSLAKSQLRPQG
jgi:hypothetical protein